LRKPKDRDYVETVDGLFFCLTGYLHPPDGYTAYPKYAPGDGIWSRDGVTYARIMRRYHVSEVRRMMEELQALRPEYVRFCPVRQIRMTFVPKRLVKRYYMPEQRLSQMLHEGPGDELEAQTVELAEAVSDGADVPVENLGVTGSILIAIHNPKYSDIDLTVYGVRSSSSVREWMRSGGDGVVEKLRGRELEEWCVRRAGMFGLDRKTVRVIASRRWNYGLFEGRRFSMHPTRTDEEITETYGDRTYRPIGFVRAVATVSDSREAMYTPAVYRVEDVKVLEGPREAETVSEVVSYEGLFCDVAYEGEQIELAGKLERVEKADGSVYMRVLVGSTEYPNSYIKPLVDRP